jgi:enoyl-CoA hydratase/carnithine racemase
MTAPRVGGTAGDAGIPYSPGMDWIRTENRGPVRRLVLDRPHRRNAVPSPDGWDDLYRAFLAFENSDARVLVVTGANGDFCSGADLDPSRLERVEGVAEHKRRMNRVGDAAAALRRLTKPTIAAVDGVAAGAGMNLALGCDVVIATTRARFSEIFVRRGLTVDFGGTWLLPRLVGPQRAKELALSGRMVEAPEALDIGLCLEVVDPADLDRRVQELATTFLGGAPVAQMFTKQGIDRAWETSFEDALDWEGQSQAICLGTEDMAEGVSAFLEKRQPEFRGR